MKAATLAITALLIASPAYANVGESQAAIEKRYGKGFDEKIVDDHQTRRSYSSQGLKIIVTFIDGVSQAETYGKQSDSQLSESEITKLLDENGRGEKWIQVKDADVKDKMWKLPDEVIVAGYNESDKKLHVFTRVLTEFHKKKKAEGAEKPK